MKTDFTKQELNQQYSIKDLAKLLNINIRTVYNAIEKHSIPVRKIGASRILLKDFLDKTIVIKVNHKKGTNWAHYTNEALSTGYKELETVRDTELVQKQKIDNKLTYLKASMKQKSITNNT